MSDFLLEISKNPHARKLIRSLGLPIPMPQPLLRARGPWEQRPLANQTVGVYLAGAGRLAEVVASTLAEAGANPLVAGAEGVLTAFKGPGEAFGRPARPLEIESGADESHRTDALIFDATDLDSPARLGQLYDFFHPLVAGVARCGRVVLLGRPPEAQSSALGAAAQAALDGFTRSLAKELGRRGATAQLVIVSQGAEDRLSGPLRFLLSRRSAYISGQPLRLTTTAKAPTKAPAWTFPLENQVALVTGAARGIGRATAQRLAAEGARVVCLDRPADDGPTSQLAREVGGATLLVDVSDDDAPRHIGDFLENELGGVDIVVHNAGVTRDKTLARMTPEYWDQAIDINLEAVARVTDALVDGPLRDGGRIICLSSVSGIAGNVGQTNYAASKAGILGLVRYLAGPLGKRGVTVNALAPGFIETRLTEAMPFAIREVARRMNSLGQAGLPVDVAEVVTFLASPGSVGITGEVLRVCGGAFVGA